MRSIRIGSLVGAGLLVLAVVPAARNTVVFLFAPS
jgi:hypothetical protein